MQTARQGLESLGFKSGGPYKLVNPATQAYMPDLPPGNIFYSDGDPKQAAQVLLLPIVEEAPKNFFQQLPRGIGYVQDENSRPEFDVMEQLDAPDVPISGLQGPRLIFSAPPGEAGIVKAFGTQ